MSKTYEGKVAWNGNHYEQGEAVSGSKIRVNGRGETEIYDDEYWYEPEIGDLTRYEWVEVDPRSVEEVE